MSNESIMQVLHMISKKLESIDVILDQLNDHEGKGFFDGIFGGTKKSSSKCPYEVYGDIKCIKEDLTDFVAKGEINDGTRIQEYALLIALNLVSNVGLGCVLAENMFELLDKDNKAKLPDKDFCDLIPLRDAVINHINDIGKHVEDGTMFSHAIGMVSTDHA